MVSYQFLILKYRVMFDFLTFLSFILLAGIVLLTLRFFINVSKDIKPGTEVMLKTKNIPKNRDIYKRYILYKIEGRDLYVVGTKPWGGLTSIVKSSDFNVIKK